MAIVLFDLDGTLLDTFALITKAFRHTCRTVLGREPTDGEMFGRWGRPLHARFEAIASDRLPELVAAYTYPMTRGTAKWPPRSRGCASC